MKRIALLALLGVVLLPACGGEVNPASTPAGKAQVRLMRDLYEGRFADAYDDLLPAQRRFVPQKLFVECARRAVARQKLESVEVLDVYDETVDVPGVGRRRTKAVRIRLSSPSDELEPFIRHTLETDGRWYWILNREAVNAYRSGDCLVPR